MYVLFVTQCSIQDHSQIYRVGDMLEVFVIPCAIQLPGCSRFLRWKAHVCVLSGFVSGAAVGLYMIFQIKILFSLK